MQEKICVNMQNSITYTKFGTNNLKIDLQTWMSSAITNLATCNDELVGPNMSTVLNESITMSLEKVTMVVSNQLVSVQQLPNNM